MTPAAEGGAAGPQDGCSSAQFGRLHELEDVLLVEIGDELVDDLVGLPGDHIVATAATEPHLSIGYLPGGAGKRRFLGIADAEARDATVRAGPVRGPQRRRR